MVRGSLARRLPNPNHLYRNAQSFNPFSTSSGGSGRGRGSPSPHFSFTARVLGQPDPAKSDSPPDETSFSSRLGRGSASAPPNQPPPPDSGLGRGHGRGIAPPSAPVRPSSFTSFGRGRARADPRFTKDGGESAVPEHVKQSDSIPLNVAPAPESAGLGRGKPVKNQAQAPVQDVNRHMRPQRQRFGDENYKERAQAGPGEAPIQEANRDVLPQRPRFGVPVDRKQAQPVPSSWKPTQPPPPPARQKMSREDAVKNARSVLSRKNDDDEEDDVRPRGSGRRARGGGRSRSYDDEDGGDNLDSVDGEFKDVDYDYDSEKDEEKEREAWIKVLGGPENYEASQKILDELLPDPRLEELIEAHNINCNFEFDPEYHMEFNTNPDIEEEPPVPLRDAIEKVRPFIMAYEGIQSHEEWEEAVEETMKLAPKLKELVDCYSGPDRITAKKQGEELERVAKTLPQGAPASVKRFTDRALLSLQSNPGWGFGKKAQFMDKLVREFSQPHK